MSPNLEDLVIQKLFDLQNNANRKYFDEGIFESTRENSFWKYKRPDTNIFFTTLIVFYLQKIKDKVSVQSQELIEIICEKAKANYPKFKNKDGLNTYNFFKTVKSGHFPHGNIMHRFEHFKIPDDVDDTAFIYRTLPHSTSDALWLQQKLAKHANLSTKKNTHTFKEYQNLRAYSTWFGKNMYVEFDVCILSNILSSLLSFGLTLDQHGQDSILYIKDVILSNKHIDYPFRVAHCYPRTIVIIYHVARLMANHSIEILEDCRPILIKNILDLLKQKQHFLDEIVLIISLLNLDISYQFQLKSKIKILQNQIESSLKTAPDFGEFYFFIGGMMTSFENKLSYYLAKQKYFHLYWRSEAFNWAIMAEFLVLTSTNEELIA